MKDKRKEVITALKGKKKFWVSYWEEVKYEKEFEASSKEELKEMFENGELDFDDKKDITDGNYIDDSLEIEEME